MAARRPRCRDMPSDGARPLSGTRVVLEADHEMEELAITVAVRGNSRRAGRLMHDGDALKVGTSTIIGCAHNVGTSRSRSDTIRMGRRFPSSSVASGFGRQGSSVWPPNLWVENGLGLLVAPLIRRRMKLLPTLMRMKMRRNVPAVVRREATGSTRSEHEPNRRKPEAAWFFVERHGWHADCAWRQRWPTEPTATSSDSWCRFLLCVPRRGQDLRDLQVQRRFSAARLGVECRLIVLSGGRERNTFGRSTRNTPHRKEDAHDYLEEENLKETAKKYSRSSSFRFASRRRRKLMPTLMRMMVARRKTREHAEGEGG